MSYGYQPPKQDRSGSWSEVFLITKVAFGLLLPLIGAIVGILLLLVAIIFLFSTHPALALIPVVPVVAGFAYLLRRERQKHEDEVARSRGD